MPPTSPPLSFRCRGPLAIFSRPELKTERFTYPVPTPSALRGIVESILWKPAIQYRVEKIAVLAPIRYQSFRRNEVNNKAVAPSAAVIENGGAAPFLMADEDRAQRNTVALRDVDYLVQVRFVMTSRADSTDNITKFVEMFERRLRRGQHFQQPFLGCRECVAEVTPVDDAPQPIQESADFGLMLWDIDYNTAKGRASNTPVFYWAKMDNGIIHVPATVEDARQSLTAFTRKGGR